MKRFDIYTKPGCPYCDKAKQLLQAKGFTYTEHVVGVNASKDSIQARVGALGQNVQITTVPQIFLKEDTGDSYIGGFDQLNQKVLSGAF